MIDWFYREHQAPSYFTVYIQGPNRELAAQKFSNHINPVLSNIGHGGLFDNWHRQLVNNCGTMAFYGGFKWWTFGFPPLTIDNIALTNFKLITNTVHIQLIERLSYISIDINKNKVIIAILKGIKNRNSSVVIINIFLLH